MMCIDILEKEEIITRRTAEHDLLMDIRNGKYLDSNQQPTSEFYDILNEYEKRFEYAKNLSLIHIFPQKKCLPKTATSDGNRKVKKKKSSHSESYLYFEEHKDTAQLMYNLSAFRPGDTIYITRKLHGTSGRTMKTTKIIKDTGRIRKLLHMKPKITKETTVITGSRRVELSNLDAKIGYYETNDFRKKWHNIFKDRLPERCV